ncbi:MAG TPA: hypothetical protein DCR55_15615, partial [Lentisphaeria bacterium]|nr:hypothetical protein [Lentisphaeria bacterium]
LINSAKSWLSHAGVDREDAILPWGSNSSDKLSPLAVSTCYLRHIRDAWNQVLGKTRDREGSPCILQEQQVVVTVPASFDETARDLTIRAARDAGLREIQLLEEPLAAFYAWLDVNADTWQTSLDPGERILVIDVGGGTTDFSFIQLEAGGKLRRFAVGEHLLLGGDNIDIALARRFEQAWKTTLKPAEWSKLVQLCRKAKEDLLNGDVDSAPITLLSRGSSLLGGTRTAELRRDELLSLLTEGFFPLLDRDAQPPQAAGIRQMGLPYAQDPAVTSHLLAFLRRAAEISKDDDSLAFPKHVLFNGGSTIPSTVRKQVLSALASWFPDRTKPVELESDYALAVARGASYYGRGRRGEGVRVQGGISHAYYTEINGPDGNEIVCLISRDTDEGTVTTVPGSFQLQTNQSVQFPLFSSATRLHDQPGVVQTEKDELSLVAPLVSVLQFGKGEKQGLKVSLRSQVTEVGALEIALESASTDHSWPLRFDLRPAIAAQTTNSEETTSVVLPAATLDAAVRELEQSFNGPPQALAKLPQRLEQITGQQKTNWTMHTCRTFSDSLISIRDVARRAAPIEARWLNLLGFCLRPGFGDPGDALRMRKVWSMWFDGLAYPKSAQNVAEWWVFWRRVAGGLKAGHQSTVSGVSGKIIAPKSKYRRAIREGEQARLEMWRCIGAMEWLPVQAKQRFGSILIKRPEFASFELWALARLGARKLFQGPENLILPPAAVTPWLTRLMTEENSQQQGAINFTLTQISEKTGVRALDLDTATRERVIDHLIRHDCSDQWIHLIREGGEQTADDTARILADSVPLGLSRRD